MATYMAGQAEVSNDFRPHPTGTLGVRYGSVTTTAAVATNDILRMMHVYPNETVFGFMLKITSASGGSTTGLAASGATISVGYQGLAADLLAAGANSIAVTGGSISVGMGSTGMLPNGPVTFRNNLTSASDRGNMYYTVAGLFNGAAHVQPYTFLDVTVTAQGTTPNAATVEMWAFIG